MIVTCHFVAIVRSKPQNFRDHEHVEVAYTRNTGTVDVAKNLHMCFLKYFRSVGMRAIYGE